MRDNGDGTYTVRYAVPNPGPLTVTVNLKTDRGRGAAYKSHSLFCQCSSFTFVQKFVLLDHILLFLLQVGTVLFAAPLTGW